MQVSCHFCYILFSEQQVLFDQLQKYVVLRYLCVQKYLHFLLLILEVLLQLILLILYIFFVLVFTKDKGGPFKNIAVLLDLYC